MSFGQKTNKEPEDFNNRSAIDLPDSTPNSMSDPMLQSTLRDFRLSVHAWSETVYNRPRPAFAATPRHRAWRRATAWALGCVLAAGVAAGGVHERHHQQELARVAAVRDAEIQRQLAEQHARDAEDLLAKVDSDISRQVPNAMEPLAQLMADDEIK
jgi:hypothetical protein